MKLHDMGFNLLTTLLISELKESGVLSEISGKQIVFTGAMTSGKRTKMEAEARKLGAKVIDAVSKKTDYLIMGENVGATKINAAKSKGVKVINEKQYLHLINKD